MNKPISPSLRTLGAAIRRHREAAGMTQDYLAGLVNYSNGWLGSVETGQLCPQKQAVVELEKVLGLPEKVLLDIFDLIRYEEPHPVISFDRYTDAESRAAVIRQYHALVLPGLLQTPDYARALIAAGRPSARPETVESLLAARLERQEILARDDPPTLWLVIDETALLRPIGGPEVHRAQLDALVEAAQRPGITVQVIPLGTGAHAGLTSAFTILSFTDEPDVAYTEDHQRGHLQERPELVHGWFAVYQALHLVTETAAASLELIRRTRERL
ncbi:helix-turn-helix domain-containing protein [Actinoallomurus acaciae]|uniref:Scr1 family TA system antitoxin-like transcriptional regulator n=1 Tax=Actinoallomurus acaciae TaxID=502577 RepID=A0ABV5YWX2_9ACTN